MVVFGLLAALVAGATFGQTTTIAAIMPAQGQFITAFEGLKSELGAKYSIVVIDINKQQGAKEVAELCKASQVEGLILMDNKAIALTKDLQNLDTAFIAMPKFVLMTLSAVVSTQGLQNASGITFEVPGYTLVTNFRIISKKDFSKVGVFYRSSVSKALIDDAKRLLAKERISLDAVCVDCASKDKIAPKDALKLMSGSLESMISQDKIEAIWLVADNVIVNGENLDKFWLKQVKARNIPIIASLETLASPQIGAAVFTADPDYTQLGIQSASQVVQYYEEGKSSKEIGFEPTISIKSIVNLSVAAQIGWGVKEEKMNRIDKIIK